MITIYTKANCSFCDKAKALMTKNNIEYYEIPIEDRVDFIKNKFPTMKTAPIIVDKGGNLVGGYDQLEERIFSDEGFGKTLLFG